MYHRIEDSVEMVSFVINGSAKVANQVSQNTSD